LHIVSELGKAVEFQTNVHDRKANVGGIQLCSHVRPVLHRADSYSLL